MWTNLAIRLIFVPNWVVEFGILTPLILPHRATRYYPEGQKQQAYYAYYFVTL